MTQGNPQPTACAGHVTGASGTPRFPGEPRKASPRFYYEICLKRVGYTLSPLIFWQSRESSSVFVGTPKCAWHVHILLGARGLPELPTLEAELNYLCHSNFASLFPKMVNLFISEWKWELRGPSVVFCSQCSQAVRAQVAQSVCPTQKHLEGGAHHLWNPSSLLPC